MRYRPLLALALLALSCSSPSRDCPDIGNVQAGVLVLSESGDPVCSAEVRFLTEDYSSTVTAAEGCSGFYSFVGDRTGKYDVRVEAEGFRASEARVTIDRTDCGQLELSALSSPPDGYPTYANYATIVLFPE